MVDSDLRKSLSQDVRRLVTGRMTNDDFDDVFYQQYDSSDDRAVREIASNCYTLYSSDLVTYRLSGRHVVDDETRCTAARAVLFLRSSREYEWPGFPDDPAIRTLAGLATFLGIPAGIALLITCVLVALSESFDLAAPLAIIGLLLLIGSAWLTIRWPSMLEPEWGSFRNSGDYAVWPFLRRDDFEHAKQNCHLLGNADGHIA